MRNSLSLRIITSGIIVVTLTLLATTLLLVYLFREHIEQHFDALLFDHIEELVAASNIAPDGRVSLNWHPKDPRFHKPKSGWYWEIRQSEKIIHSSLSLQGNSLKISRILSNGSVAKLRQTRLLLSELTKHSLLGKQQFSGPDNMLLRAKLLSIPSPVADQALLYVVTGPVSEIEHNVGKFARQVAISFFVLGSGLLFAVFIQVRVALKPLRAMRKAIAQVHQGEKKRLPENYPDEIQLVVSEINSLLDHRAQSLARARKNLGNLAHTIKNPLAVIINEADSIGNESGQLMHNKAQLIAANLDHYLAQARAAGTDNLMGYRTDITKVVSDLCYSLNQLYQDKHIKITILDLGNYCFRGEIQDLEEMLGNIIDNACKWTRNQIWVYAKLDRTNQRVLLYIEDNGPGIPDNQLINVLQRGKKLDETIPGHGLGLNIVSDITQLYKGSLTLEKSPQGGLRAILDLPAAACKT